MFKYLGYLFCVVFFIRYAYINMSNGKQKIYNSLLIVWGYLIRKIQPLNILMKSGLTDVRWGVIKSATK